MASPWAVETTRKVTVEGLEIDLPFDMEVRRVDGDKAGVWDAIFYKGVDINVAEKEYKPELRPGPFFIFMRSGKLKEFVTIYEARAFINKNASQCEPMRVW